MPCEVAAQLVQRNAGAGLFHAQRLRGARNALCFVDFNEDAEPVQVKFCHGVSASMLYKNDIDNIINLPLT
jgi:hypothetical protein